MADDTNPKTCRKTDCQVATTGSCAEGHTPLASCPNYGDQPVERSDAYDGELEPSAEGATPDVERVGLPSGDALTPDDVDQFLRWRAATFVTVIGDSHSGKTTLICAIYERFLKGCFAGFGFAGSRTLVALERRSHHSRVDSGRVTPETARTSHLEGLRYFHFAMAQDGYPNRRADLLLSDRSGEVYRSARNNSSVVTTLPELPRLIGLCCCSMAAASQTLSSGRRHSICAPDPARLRRQRRSRSDVNCADRHYEDRPDRGERGAAENQWRAFSLSQQANQRFCAEAEILVVPRYRCARSHQPVCTCPRPRHARRRLGDTSSSLHVAAPPFLTLQSEFDRLIVRTPVEVFP